ncbi:MAG: type II toxin-antitoxin system HicB family antitoxin [Anaerolineae bacterium]|nr:type II toxin-antitoxin system HicB family antitoxin [Anaerolineae bacterium]
MRFPVVIHKDADSDYGVTVPDLPGCFSAGENMDEALTMAREAIETHIEGMLIDGEPIPSPKSIELYIDNPDYMGGVWAIVEVDISKLSGNTRRVNITLPERLLNMMDNYAAEQGESRSGLIARATMAFIAARSS